ncbi:hypothetical protein N665_0032s0009 [Sinapis alba]|nr:hypothetical protein N665_0032s0009 [Sinapis alba]
MEHYSWRCGACLEIHRLGFRFSLLEFETIMALNCAPFVANEDVNETKVRKGFGTQNSSFVYLSILATFIIGGDDKKELPLELACMVFDFPKFEKYPWGRVAFKKLIASVKLGRPSNINGPPILKFKGLKGTNNININIVSIADKDDIRNIEKRYQECYYQSCKTYCLGHVTWVEHGPNNSQINTGAEVGGESEEKMKKMMKIDLEQQTKKVETLESKLEEMGKQLQSY